MNAFYLNIKLQSYQNLNDDYPSFFWHLNLSHGDSAFSQLSVQSSLISEMHLYNLTLHKATGVQRAIYGSVQVTSCHSIRQFQFTKSGRVRHFERKHSWIMETRWCWKHQYYLQFWSIWFDSSSQTISFIRYLYVLEVMDRQWYWFHCDWFW